jgi:HSP20 family protein
MVQVKWEPFRDLMAMQDRMTRIFDETLSRMWKAEGMGRTQWQPSVDIREKEEALVLEIDLPGVNQNEIDIKVEDNTLIIQGERRFARESQTETYVQMERPQGVFRRAFSLSRRIDQEKIKAGYKDGVLRIVLQKKENPVARQITPEE